MAQDVKIIFEVEGIQKTVSSVEELETALKDVEKQSKKTEKTLEKTAKEAQDLGKKGQEAGEAAEGGIKVIDEAFGGIGTKIKEVSKGIKAMGKGLVTSFKSGVKGASALKKGLIATGIGAIVVALGLIVAYWDDIVGAISGVSADQKKLLADTQATAAARQQSLDATTSSENSLKLQGKSEREIRDLKIQQTDEVISATEQVLEQQRLQAKAQEEAMQRNKDIAQNVIRLLMAPVTLLLKTVDMMTAAVSKIPGIDIATNLEDAVTGGLANMLFDPEETAEAGAATVAETEKQLAALKNKRDGYKLQNQADETKAREEKLAAEKAAEDAAIENAKQKAQELADLKKSIREAEANSEAEQRAKALEDLDLYYEELILKAEEQGILTNELEASQLEASNALKQKYADEDSARAAAAKKEAKDKADYEKQLEKDVADAKLDVAGNAFGAIAQLSGESSAVGKAAAVSATVINTYKGAQSAYADTVGGPIIKGIAAAIAVATGALSVKKIISTKTPGNKTAPGGSQTAPTLPSGPRFDPTEALASAVGNQEAENVVTLGDQQGSSGANVIRAYVVSDEMTSQQEADAKINDLARL